MPTPEPGAETHRAERRLGCRQHRRRQHGDGGWITDLLVHEIVLQSHRVVADRAGGYGRLDELTPHGTPDAVRCLRSPQGNQHDRLGKRMEVIRCASRHFSPSPEHFLPKPPRHGLELVGEGENCLAGDGWPTGQAREAPQVGT